MPKLKANQTHYVSKKLEDYQPGANRALVLDVLKKVAISPRPSPKHSEQPVLTSKET